MGLFEWIKRLGRTLDSRTEPTDVVGAPNAPTSVLAETSAEIRQEVDDEQELEEGR